MYSAFWTPFGQYGLGGTKSSSTPCAPIFEPDLLHRAVPRNHPPKSVHVPMRPRLAFVFRKHFRKKTSRAGFGRINTRQPDSDSAMGFKRRQQRRRVGTVFANKFESIVEGHDNRRVDPIIGGGSQVLHAIIDGSDIACIHKTTYQVVRLRLV